MTKKDTTIGDTIKGIHAPPENFENQLSLIGKKCILHTTLYIKMHFAYNNISFYTCIHYHTIKMVALIIEVYCIPTIYR